MFTKKQYTIRIDRHSVVTGIVTLSDAPVFTFGGVLEYTSETLGRVLKEIKSLGYTRVRVVLSDELVYVVGLVFPSSTDVTRESVGKAVAEIIPEDLQSTDWDFRTLCFTKKDTNKGEIYVQGAVFEHSFIQIFQEAVRQSRISISSILPESYVLAQCESNREGVSLIVQQYQKECVLVGAEAGFVIATRVKAGEATEKDLRDFIDFMHTHKSKMVTNIVCSQCSPSMVQLISQLVPAGRGLLVNPYNPLVRIALEEKVSGDDAEVLNLNMFSKSKYQSFWSKFF